MKCGFCKRETPAVDSNGHCFSCVDIKPNVRDIKRQPRPETPQPREFAEVTPALRLAHIGHWLTFYTAGLRMDSPINPGTSARRAASLADAALGRLLKCIPQLNQPQPEEINPVESQSK